MANPPRRPISHMDAAEALFKPAKPPVVVPVREVSAVPNAKELVSIKLDRAILEHFQEDGPGWQDRINDALRAVVEKKI